MVWIAIGVGWVTGIVSPTGVGMEEEGASLPLDMDLHVTYMISLGIRYGHGHIHFICLSTGLYTQIHCYSPTQPNYSTLCI